MGFQERFSIKLYTIINEQNLSDYLPCKKRDEFVIIADSSS
ncbi:hypothetical protein Dtox_3848 [Desulfofarcimen acetoxidans DSM 771]|uniref:Uncharacterized protein n=1 Tax=Desulfofarcimen acetoxidans (strain ATCC 49208 / DSM 771 / KCTC 5769 / VKM B-1644 / 5575) TaxID=485916 RepID=C8VXF6_DESAS|nr:hypothetical protein Dtox_3848 [Desulfofarcimen acetoxidans DSM 771]